MLDVHNFYFTNRTDLILDLVMSLLELLCIAKEVEWSMIAQAFIIHPLHWLEEMASTISWKSGMDKI